MTFSGAPRWSGSRDDEHIYSCRSTYRWRGAGFHQISVTEPAFADFYSHDQIHLTLGASALGSFKLAAINLARRLRYLAGPQVFLQTTRTKSAMTSTELRSRPATHALDDATDAV
jgi:hypothetical protein